MVGKPEPAEQLLVAVAGPASAVTVAEEQPVAMLVPEAAVEQSAHDPQPPAPLFVRPADQLKQCYKGCATPARYWR